jgi:hypothetical protein
VNEDEVILVALNLSDQTANVTVEIPNAAEKRHFVLPAWTGDVCVRPGERDVRVPEYR